jgi:hypothetical protein
MADNNTEDLKPENTGEIRNEKGQFIEGVSGNPNGRPKGSGISITTEIKRKLEEVPEGQKSTYLELLINRILKQAIQDGDTQMIKQVWAYIDGMPVQPNAEIPQDKIDDYLHIYKPEKNDK